MEPTLTSIDPDFPVCWENPETLRVGFEHPIARVTNPTAGMQRFVGALRRGIDAEQLTHEARLAGATVGEARATVAQLEPALLARRTAKLPAERTMPTALMCDAGRSVPAFPEVLRAAGACWFPPAIIPAMTPATTPAEQTDIDLVIFVERYWEPLERAQRWLMDEVPHLLVRFTDRAVHVGPIVPARGRPCHTCVSLERIERDPATAALAAQLAGAPVASERPESAVLAAAYAAELVHAWSRGDTDAHRTRIVLPVSSARFIAQPRIESVEPHPECACGARSDDAALPAGRDQSGLADEP